MCPMSQGDGRNPSSSNQTTPQEDYTHTIVVGQQSAVQPRANVPRRSGGAKDGKLQEDDDGSNLLAALQQACFENYHTFAYTIIIGSYFIAFCLYLYLRLVSWIFPQKIIYKRHCQKHENETIVRMELHYASATATFLVMATFQLVCFFFLTISSKWLEVRRTFTNFISMEERLRNELVFAIKRVMFVTVLPSFVVYLLSSIVVTLAIFYMVGMRDSVNHVGSQVIIYFFDGCMCVYFAAFPLICGMYHPDIKLFACCSSRRKLQTAQRRIPNCSSRPDPQPAISVDIRQVPAASHQRSQAESSILENTQQAAVGPGGSATFVSKQPQSCSSSTTSGRSSIQQWAKGLPLNPTNIHAGLRVDNAGTTSKYRRLSDEIRQKSIQPPIDEIGGVEQVVGADDAGVQTGEEGPRRRTSVNKKI